MSKVYTDYFFTDKKDYDKNDGGYVPLRVPKVKPQKLRIPEPLKPYKETKTDMYYHIISETGETQLLPGRKTKTWGYNQSLLGKTIIFKRGKTIHLKFTNNLPVLTTYHLHGLNVPGDVDGGCHTPWYPGETKTVSFKCNQPASTCWLHAHPCPSTAEQVWHGLAAAIVILDQNEERLPIPHHYGVDDVPLILQDRRFHKDNQWHYLEDYNPDGVQGPTPMIDGTLNPYFDVTTQKVRFRLLDGANRREWRLHFSNDLQFTQIGGDGSLLPHPVKLTKLMITCAERAEILVDFSQYKPGDTVKLYCDQTPIVTFKIHKFAKDNSKLPATLAKIPNPPVTKGTPIRKVVMNGTDEFVAINNKKFNMQRIDTIQTMGKVEYWDVTNANKCCHGMLHPYHMHGCQFRVVSRNGHAPYPNEHGLKDTISVNPGETVRLKVWFNCPGVFMYHCHIIEHEDGGMMAQIKVIDPKHPHKKYHLMDMKTLTRHIAKERHIKPQDVWMGGMEAYRKMNMKM